MSQRNRIRAAVLVLAGSLGLGFFVLILANHQGSSQPSQAATRTDTGPLAKRFPFLGNFKGCSWVGGVKDNRSRSLVPAPSSYFLRGYVVLELSETKELLERYPWVESKTETIPRPSEPLGEGFPKVEGSAWKSEALIRDLPSMTEYASGTILLQPEGNLLYLDLKMN
jgi:hypothetical protein